MVSEQGPRRYTYLAWIALVIPWAAAAQGPNQAAARQTLVELLKTSADAPPVEPTLHSQVIEQGLLVEDLSWESTDTETVPAILIRPAEADGPLPAVVCLHGSSGSRESMVTR